MADGFQLREDRILNWPTRELAAVDLSNIFEKAFITARDADDRRRMTGLHRTA